MTPSRKEDPLSKRYAYKLSTNLIGFGIGIFAAGIVPRGLGPKAYGDFSFLSDFFSRLVGFFDTGTSLGFFTKISQRNREYALIRYYWGFVSVASIILVVLISGVLLLGQEKLIWPDQEPRFIWLAVFWGLLTWVSENISKLVDAYALTARGEIIRMSQKLIGTAMLLLMFWLNRFTLTEFFVYHYLILLFICAAWWHILRDNGIPLLPGKKLTRPKVIAYTKEFYTYSAPLLVYALVGLVVGIFDRWLLQKFAGSAQQGFYGLSYRIGTICFLFTSALTPLFMREFSVAFGEKKKKRCAGFFQDMFRCSTPSRPILPFSSPCKPTKWAWSWAAPNLKEPVLRSQ